MPITFSECDWRDGWYVVPYEVPWRDVDSAGHVNNAVYFSLFEWGRTRYWFDLTGTRELSTINFIVARAECDFRRQISIGDRIEILTRVGEIRNSSFVFECEIRGQDGLTAATGKVVVVMYDWERQEKQRVDDALRRQIRRFQHEE